MNNNSYLKRIFQAYYKENQTKVPKVTTFNEREFGFIPWDKQIMIRHMAFRSLPDFHHYLIENGPRHVYSSGSFYLQPDHLDMNGKEYKGCDLIIDIDVDHFYTPCKDDHDLWFCKSCNMTGKGIPTKCPECGKKKFSKLTWICSDCLEIAKEEIKKLINNFLIPDFGIDLEEIKIAFSGHRGYHLRVENKRIQGLLSDERREIVDYLTGKNLSLELLGLNDKGGIIYGLTKNGFGWSKKLIKTIKEFLMKPVIEIQHFLMSNPELKFNQQLIDTFVQTKDDFLEVLSSTDKNIWSIESFGLTRWKKFLRSIVNEVGAEIDEPVSIDIHRLIRYPGSLHGKTGFKVQELELRKLDDFNPLNESNGKLDPIVFSSKNMQKLKIIEPLVPSTQIKDKKYGPYKQDEIIEVPHHIAVFLLCKEVAVMI